MNKFFKLLLSALCILTFAIAGCTPTEPEGDNNGGGKDPVPESITASAMKTEFEYGEEFSYEGLSVKINFDDNSERTAESSEYTVDSSAFNANIAGDYSILIKLNGTDITTSYNVTVKPEPEHNWNDDGSLKILAIGNSFSDDMMQYVWSIAISLGVKQVILGNLYIGGCTLATHVSNAYADKAAYDYRTNKGGVWNTVSSHTMGDAIASENWDFVTLQQASGSSGEENTYECLPELISYVKEKLPEDAHTKIVWHMTWAYQGNSTHAEFSKYGNSQTTMYESILSSVKNKVVTNEDIYAVIPNGTAIQNARTSYIGDNFTRDGYHLTMDLGRYIAGLTLVKTLTGLPLDKVWSPQGILETQKNIAVESAENAVNTPFEVTTSQYTENPGIVIPEGYTELKISLVRGFYDSTSTSDPLAVISNNTSLSSKFFATRRFTKEELPAGSIITVEPGWQYRPDAWLTNEKQTARPDNVTAAYLEITDDWWGEYIYRGFNVSKIGTPNIEGLDSEAEAAFKIYVKDGVLADDVPEGYTELKYAASKGFYNSTDAAYPTTILQDNASLSPKFFATKRFTKEELPVGSILVVSTGWQYRPESWTSEEKQPSRPDNVKTERIEITEEWWANYTRRAFNIAKTDMSVINDRDQEAYAAFRIFIKSN